MFKQLTAAAGITALLIAGVASAEAYAGHQQSETVRSTVNNLFPQAQITRIDPHGRPFIAERLTGKGVSTAYVDITGPNGPSNLILERLNRDSGRVDSLLWFNHLPQPAPLEPILTSEGAYTDRGNTLVKDVPVTVTYSATLVDGTLQVRPTRIVRTARSRTETPVPAEWTAALTPRPVHLTNADGFTVRGHVDVRGSDLQVQLQKRNADGGHRAAGAAVTPATPTAR